jgi:hypothetical protein
LTKFRRGIKNGEFYAKSKSVEKVAKKLTKKLLTKRKRKNIFSQLLLLFVNVSGF